MEDRQATLARLADLVDRIELLHARLHKLELAIDGQLRRN
jgi:hypothetical protein